MAAAAGARADVAILTVIEEAHVAACQILGLTSTEDRLGQPFAKGSVPGIGGELTVICDRATHRSNQPALDAANRIIRAWNPRLFIVADIGGGVFGEGKEPREGVRLGDVIYASDLEYFEFAKEIEGGGEEARKFPFVPPSRGPRALLNLLKHEQTDWHLKIRPSRPDGDTSPVLVEGQIIVGEKLLADPDSATVKKLVKMYPKAVAVDMESVGAASAVYGLQQEDFYPQFLVLRGISDYFDRPANQQTRDAWRSYAAEASIAAALLVIKNINTQNVVTAAIPTAVGQYIADFRRRLVALVPQPNVATFRLHLVTAPRGTVPSGTGDSDTEIERHDVLETLLQERRVVLYGPSGAGKSETLGLLARQMAAESDHVVVFVDLKRFQPQWGEQLSEQPVGEALTSSMDAVLDASIELLSIQQLEDLAADRVVLLLVDGMNEVPAAIASRILTALHEFARHCLNAHVLVTDRQAGLFYRETDWKFIALRGLRESDARDVVDSDFGSGTFDRLDEEERRLLELPFFLDKALRSKNPRLESRAQAVAEYLRLVGCTDDELECAASAAFHAYQERRNYFDKDEVQSLREGGLLKKLETAAVVVTRGQQKSFSHQLVHQFLAARHLAKAPARWTPDELDAVTADAASLDAVSMTLWLIPDQDSRDSFLRAVHDWNWRATLLALREVEGTDRTVSEGVEIALLALSAEKRFDPVLGTRRRVESQLGLLRSSHARRMLEQPKLGDLLDYVDKVEPVPCEQWYRVWKGLFTGMRGGEIAEADASKVSSDDPVLGWTVANALRRFPESETRSVQLRTIYEARQHDDARDRAVRWRVAHTLGVWPTQDNARFLLRVLDSDEYRWCRYGAVRSLVEMAARTEDSSLRQLLLDELKARIDSIDPEPLSELIWAAQYSDARPGWVEAVRPLLESVRSSRPAGSVERERWDRRMESFDQYAKGITA